MTVARISELGGLAGQVVTVRGWVVTTRSSGKIAFVVIRDGSGIVQGIVARKEVDDATWERFGQLTHETSVALTGEVRPDARSPGGVELGVQGIEVLGASPDFPITPKEHGTTFLF
jgi:asparaginyl-tRNA synthetase